jgi:transposase
LLDQLNPKIAELTAAVEQEANQRPDVLRLMTHPGVGDSDEIDHCFRGHVDHSFRGHADQDRSEATLAFAILEK